MANLVRAVGSANASDSSEDAGALSLTDGRRTRLVLALVVMGTVTLAGSLLLQGPVLATHPLFVAVNTATAVSMVALGGYMVFERREVFTGRCFVVAGIGWLPMALFIYPGWGSWLSWTLGDGAVFYTPLVWGSLRFGRPRLVHRSERVGIVLCVLLTTGADFSISLFVRPEWISYPAQASWPSFWPSKTGLVVGGIVVDAGYGFLALYFVFLARRMLREAPLPRKYALRPLCGFAITLGLGSAFINIVTLPLFNILTEYSLATIIGSLALATTAGLFVAMVRQDIWSARLVEILPILRTPESVTSYLKTALDDDTAELLFRDTGPEQRFVDVDGHHREITTELGTGRFHEWVVDGKGEAVALLVGDSKLWNETDALVSVRRVMSVLAENTRLQAVVRAQIDSIRQAHASVLELGLAERRRLERDLHDGAQQSLLGAAAALGMAQLHAGEGEQTKDALDNARASVQSALRDLRELARGLHPLVLTEQGLGAALAVVVEKLQMPIELEVTTERLAIAVEATAYFVACEAITNVVKHGHARSATVAIDRREHQLWIVISDDGCGGADSAGSGVLGMANRILALGGEFSLVSPAGQGTRITAWLPCA